MGGIKNPGLLLVGQIGPHRQCGTPLVFHWVRAEQLKWVRVNALYQSSHAV
jgi:hypothetical protein